MILLAFLFFAALIVAWLLAPNGDKVDTAPVAGVAQIGEALA